MAVLAQESYTGALEKGIENETRRDYSSEAETSRCKPFFDPPSRRLVRNIPPFSFWGVWISQVYVHRANHLARNLRNRFFFARFFFVFLGPPIGQVNSK